jgi:ribonucleoside-triphosphate reductase
MTAQKMISSKGGSISHGMVDLDVAWGPIGKQVYERTYSRTKPDGTKETWRDTVERVVDGNLALVADRFHEVGERNRLIELIYSMQMIPAGRHLWATGVPGRQYLANCHSAGWIRRDLTQHFTFSFEELMKGGGVGSNYSNRHIEMYPPIFSEVKLHIVCNPSHPNAEEIKPFLSKEYTYNSRNRFIVHDSREGWSQGLAEVLEASWHGRETPLICDVSTLRERGAILRSFGGKSSGPAPLVEMLYRVSGILNSKVGKKLTSIDMMEIDHEISKVVVAGGIRRSARMSIKYWADRDIFDFIHAKIDPEKHWTTNISVEVDEEFFRALRRRDKFATRVLNEVAAGMHRDGEPGFWNSSLSGLGEVETPFTTNPCGEIAFGPWDVCNLGHINLEQFAGHDAAAYDAFRLMTRFLMRATFGDIMNPHQKDVINRNRRIGVGFFGYHPWVAYQGVRFSESHHNPGIRRTVRTFFEVCRKEADSYASQLRIPTPIKVSCVAPTGTISLMPGVTSGCQPIFARYFQRRVRYADNDANLEQLIKEGHPVEDSKNEPGTKIISFFCKDPLVASCEERELDMNLIEEQSDISLSDHLAVQAMLQQEYADNCISYTINFDPKKIKVEEITAALKIHLPYLKGTTLMPENSREQMPFERISMEQFLDAHGKGLTQISDAERECQNGSCPVK